MKISLLATLFIVLMATYNTVLAQPLQYNLQKGDEWVVKISSNPTLGYVSPSPGNWYLDASKFDYVDQLL